MGFITEATTSKSPLTEPDSPGSGYADLGDLRIQWGTVNIAGGPNYVLLPKPFGSHASYHVQVSISQWWSCDVLPSAQRQTAHQFIIGCLSTATGMLSTTNIPVSWLAIGKRPA